jgi:hypothetical protein
MTHVFAHFPATTNIDTQYKFLQDSLDQFYKDSFHDVGNVQKKTDNLFQRSSIFAYAGFTIGAK